MTSEEARRARVAEQFQKLSSSQTGLTDSEVQKRLQQYAYNEIPEKKKSPVVKFLGYFWGPIPWMIEAAVALSGIVGRWEDFWIIMALLLLNAVVGFWQENKADNAIELLKRKLALVARVRRNGQWGEVPARELVPGDVVRVRLGDILPADVILVEGDYLLADESALTGESLPVEKHLSDAGYSGSIVRQGEMNGLVVATGLKSYFGKTARLVEEAKTESHFQRAIIKIGDYLIALAIGLVALIFLVSLFREESVLVTLQFALVLIVAAIPVALPAVLTVTMAVGATALAKKEAIVSKLASIEEMAGVDILCSDKTGTITKNQLTMADPTAYDGFSDKDVLIFAALASREEDKDPIDDAIISKAKKTDGLAAHLGQYKVAAFKPFDPVSKRTEATVENANDGRFRVAKGAPQAVLELVADKGVVGVGVEKGVEAFATRGFRALGVARTDAEGKWHYVGLIPLYDPPREDSAPTIKAAQSMGVHVKMVTGDHVAIAKEIAKQVNLGRNIVAGSTFLEKHEREAEHFVETADGFAQVFPEHKYRIVELLQSAGHIVGMTGDGVNDAPALKKADAGIAVAGATDAAKSAADIVLTKPGLSVIIDAIKESRKIFERMTNYAIYRISETIRVLFFITLSIIVFQFYPVTALMIVLLALLNDAPIMSIAYDNVKVSDRPDRWNMRIVLGLATILGLVGVVSSFGLFYMGERIFHLSRELIQSFIYLKLSVAGQLTVFVARTRGPFWSIRPAKILLMAFVGTQTVATLITVYGILLTPLGWSLALIVWAYALFMFVVTDQVKVRAYRLLESEGTRFKR
jgi:H+-transporting ATPase